MKNPQLGRLSRSKREPNRQREQQPSIPSGGIKRGLRMYAAIVLAITLALSFGMTAFAAGNGDPLQTINNLSDFIFGLIRAIELILLGSASFKSVMIE